MTNKPTELPDTLNVRPEVGKTGCFPATRNDFEGCDLYHHNRVLKQRDARIEELEAIDVYIEELAELATEVKYQSNGRTTPAPTIGNAIKEAIKKDARIEELETICAEAYQVMGCFSEYLPDEKILDNLSQAEVVHKDILPFEPTQDTTIAKQEDKIRELVGALEDVKRRCEMEYPKKEIASGDAIVAEIEA